MTARRPSLSGALFAPAPAERLAAVRFFVGAYATLYVLVRFRYFADLSRLDPAAFAPVGLLRALASPPPLGVAWVTTALALASSVALMVGARHRVSGPVCALSLLWVFSARSSWGKILHTENLLVLHVALLALAPATDALSLDARRAMGARAARARSPSARYGWPLRAMSLVTALTYFVAGAAKLRAGGFAWLSGRPLAEWLAWDAVRKIELGSFYSPLGPMLATRPLTTAGLAVLTLVVELGAPLSLVNRRAARAWAFAAWSFHAGVLATMAIGFFYPLTFVAYASLFDAELVPAWLSRRRARARARRGG